MSNDSPGPAPPTGSAHGPAVIGFTVTQLESGEWVASAVVLSGPDGEGLARHVVVSGQSREEAVRSLVRKIDRIEADPLPDARSHRAG